MVTSNFVALIHAFIQSTRRNIRLLLVIGFMSFGFVNNKRRNIFDYHKRLYKKVYDWYGLFIASEVCSFLPFSGLFSFKLAPSIVIGGIGHLRYDSLDPYGVPL